MSFSDGSSLQGRVNLKPLGAHSTTNADQESSRSGDKLTCSVCNTVFLSEELLGNHLLSFTTCNVCKVHLPLDWVLEAHYATADGHPKCERCGFGFRDEEEFSLHIFECWADVPDDFEPAPEPESERKTDSKASSVEALDDAAQPSGPRDKGKAPMRPFTLWGHTGTDEDTATGSDPNTAAGRRSPAPPYTGHTTDTLITSTWIASESHLEREIRSPNSTLPDQYSSALGGAEIDRTNQMEGNAHDEQARQSARVDKRSSSSSGHTSRFTSTELHDTAHADVSSRAQAQQHPQSPASRPALKHASTQPPSQQVNGVAHHSPVVSSSCDTQRETITRISTSSHTGGENHGEVSLSWHCRICSQDPCVEPVTTMCGHLFCKRCIMNKMALSPSSHCPVCQKMFFLGLNVSGT